MSKVKEPVVNKITYKAIITLKERSGSSRQALKKYVQSNYDLKAANFDALFNTALRKGVEVGDFLQPKGPSGPVKISKENHSIDKATKPKVTKPKITKKTTPKVKKLDSSKQKLETKKSTSKSDLKSSTKPKAKNPTKVTTKKETKPKTSKTGPKKVTKPSTKPKSTTKAKSTTKSSGKSTTTKPTKSKK